MKPVDRESLLDYVTYEEQRDSIRRRVLAEKARRRVHVADVLTFLFENTDTVRYQVQETMRTERLVEEGAIQRELATRNELLGKAGELGCTLLIEIADAEERGQRLAAWMELPWHVFARVEDGEKVYARFDGRQVAEERLSSVHYLKFDTGGRVPVAVGVDLQAQLEGETELTGEVRAALAEDLAID